MSFISNISTLSTIDISTGLPMCFMFLSNSEADFAIIGLILTRAISNLLEYSLS